MFNISIAQISIWSNALYNSRGNQINIAQITILQLLFTNQMLVFDERGKREYPGKNLSWQSRGPTNSIHIWHRVRKSNPGHIGGRQELSPEGQPCHKESNMIFFFSKELEITLNKQSDSIRALLLLVSLWKPIVCLLLCVFFFVFF